MENIYLGLTTWNCDWHDKIDEANSLGISEVALFPTTVDRTEREKLYLALENSSIQRIPFVHLRHDHEPEEIEYLIKRFRSEVFNVHASKENLENLPKFKKIIDRLFVENSNVIDEYFIKILDNCAGVCLDISHYEDFGLRQHREGYDKFDELLKTHKIGCCHIPAVRDKLYECETHGSSFKVYESHHMGNLSEMDYLKNHFHLFSDYNAIELNNSFADQLKVKEYIEKMLR